VPSMPARLAARAPMMGAGMPSGAVPMVGGPMRAPMMDRGM
jgi:hypothetical protein